MCAEIVDLGAKAKVMRKRLSRCCVCGRQPKYVFDTLTGQEMVTHRCRVRGETADEVVRHWNAAQGGAYSVDVRGDWAVKLLVILRDEFDGLSPSEIKGLCRAILEGRLDDGDREFLSAPSGRLEL